MTENDEDRYESFMTLHAGELRAKAEAAVGTSCPVCLTDPMKLRMDSVLPWLVCDNGHKVRPWTEDELDAMDRVSLDDIVADAQEGTDMRSRHR